MSETISVYAGTGKVGILKKRAVEKEARRMGTRISVSDIFWKFMKAHGSEKLRRDLEAAEAAGAK